MLTPAAWVSKPTAVIYSPEGPSFNSHARERVENP
jgi:hypothetical protein